MQWTEKRKKTALGIVSAAVVLGLCALLSLLIWKYLSRVAHTPTAFKDFIESYGWGGRLVALGIQILQVVIALIPGELVELGLGYAFGPVEGTLLCLAGTGLASAAVFVFTKRFGVRMVEWFVPRQKIDELRLINSEKRLKRTLFLLFFIPGTPKDLFTYFFGLTRVRLHEFLVISLLARIPSVVSSTFGGHLIEDQEYLSAAVLLVITGALSLSGLLIYQALLRRHRRRKEEKA